MRKLTPLWINCMRMLLLVVLTSCAANPTTSSVLSTPPTVECAEHAPGEHLPAYPVGPRLTPVETVVALQARQAPDSDYARQLALAAGNIQRLQKYSAEQSRWAIEASGIVHRDGIRRATTADCLDAYRARGIIH